MSNKLLMNNMVVTPEPPPSGTYQQVLGMTPLQVDNTVHGELEEVEILGNTWQDSDSKNLCPINGEVELQKYGGAVLPHKITNLPPFKLNIDYTLSYKEGPNTNTNTWLNITGIIGGKEERITLKQNYGSVTFKVTKNYDEYILAGYTDRVARTVYDIQIEEGKVATPYEPYHKADYSNIKHLGELQPDGKYKIDVKSGNTKFNNITNSVSTNIEVVSGYSKKISETKGEFKSEGKGHNAKLTINIPDNIYINDDHKFSIYIIKFNRKPPIPYSVTHIIEGNYLIINTKSDKKIFEFSSYIEGNMEFNVLYSYEIENIFYTNERQDINTWKQFKSSTQTLLLDQPLMKVGDVQDRLFYDKSKGEYVIGKRTKKLIFSSENKNIIAKRFLNGKTHCAIVLKHPDLETSNQIRDTVVVSSYSSSHVRWDPECYDKNVYSTDPNNGIYFSMPHSVLPSVTQEEAMKYILNLNPTVYTMTVNTELIPTGIKQEMKLFSYDETTHLFVEGGLNGGIKANVPTGGIPVKNGLICWLESSDYDGSSVWIDKSGNNNNADMIGFDNVNNGLINGVIKMGANCKIAMPNPFGMKSVFMSFKQGEPPTGQINLVGTSPKTARYCLRNSDWHTYYAGISEGNQIIVPIDPDPKGPAVALSNSYKKVPNGFDNWVGFGINFNGNSHQNLTFGYDPNNSGNPTLIEFIAVYDRDLTIEEAKLLYDYIKNKTNRITIASKEVK